MANEVNEEQYPVDFEKLTRGESLQVITRLGNLFTKQRTTGTVESDKEAKAKRAILVEGYSALVPYKERLNKEELMKRFKHGWGTCQKCKRIIGASSKGKARRHGWTKRRKACKGSGKLLRDWRKSFLWDGRGLNLD